MNTKETLRKLHKKFPNLSLDDLFAILDCYTEDIKYNWNGNSTSITANYGDVQLTASH